MSYPTQGIVANALPGTGVFGFGQVQVFPVSGTFTVPAGVNNVRVRLWGGGGANGGGGGGFAMRTIFNLAGLGFTTIAVTVPQAVTSGVGGTASFGSFVSATGGSSGSADNPGGTGVGGDINTTGGFGRSSGAGGGVASMWGNGGDGGNPPSSGASGGGSSGTGSRGAAGLTGNGGSYNTTTSPLEMPKIGPSFSIDLIGTGGGGGPEQSGINGGGSGLGASGGFPGGGGVTRGAAGLVIVEY